MCYELSGSPRVFTFKISWLDTDISMLQAVQCWLPCLHVSFLWKPPQAKMHKNYTTSRNICKVKVQNLYICKQVLCDHFFILIFTTFRLCASVAMSWKFPVDFVDGFACFVILDLGRFSSVHTHHQLSTLPFLIQIHTVESCGVDSDVDDHKSASRPAPILPRRSHNMHTWQSRSYQCSRNHAAPSRKR